MWNGRRPLPAPGRSWCILKWMLRFAILAALSGCLLVGVAGDLSAQGLFEAKGKAEFRPNAVLVAFQPGTSTGRRSRVVTDLGLRVDTNIKSPHFARLLLPPNTRRSATAYIDTLKRLPEVRVAELDFVYRTAQAAPNDPKFSQQWALRNTGQTGGTAGADINALNAWAVTTGSEGTIVAVIDTGVDASHPDLSANILRDGSNQVIGYDFYSNDNNPTDEDGHGSHVAGTIGAVTNNNVGVAGVAHRVRIMPVRFLGPDGGTTAGAIESIDFARTNGAHIMNNSWGGGGHSQLMKEAIERARDAGILFVAAAGNAGRNVDNSPFYPASYNREVSNVVSVGATNDRDQRASFSNYGLTVDMFAPGEGILSTVPVAYDSDGTPDGYDTYSGTSMASPHVAGAASLIKSRFPTLGAAQLKKRLLFGAQSKAALEGLAQFGRLESLMILDNDTVVPFAPTRLSVAKTSPTTLEVEFETTGDDGYAGQASRYELRFAGMPVTEANFDQARLAEEFGLNTPSGASQRRFVRGLFPGGTYYAALRAYDNVGNPSRVVSFGPLATGPAMWSDRVEGAPQFTASSGSAWSTTDQVFYSSKHSWTDSPGDYTNNSDTMLTLNAAVPVPQLAFLRFHAKMALETGYDFLDVEVSSNGGTSWSKVLSLTGFKDWSPYSVPLSQFAGSNALFRFRMRTDSSIVYDGVYLDDIQIVSFATVYSDNLEGVNRFAGDAPWALVTTNSHSPTRSWHDSPGGNYANDLNLLLTGTNTIPISGIADPHVMVWAQLALESGYDWFSILTANNGESQFGERVRFTGTAPWAALLAPIGAASSTRIQFKLTTDYSIVDDGVHVDDISIVGEAQTSVALSNVSGIFRFSSLATGALPPGGAVIEVRPVGSTAPVMAYSVPLGSLGQFAMVVPRGDYDVSLKIGSWLRRTFRVNASGGDVTGIDVTFTNGDVNGDNSVNLVDFLMLRAAFGSTSASPNWNENADLNRDGTVNATDFLILRGNLGRTGDS